MTSEDPYWDWIKTQAFGIKSDGCTGVRDFRLRCCYEHDLSYFYGRCPQSAYLAWQADPKSDVWSLAGKITRSEADARFRKCNQDLSPVGEESPMAWMRWIGVRLGGWNAWRKHRKARP
jgi:hypothetical protein